MDCVSVVRRVALPKEPELRSDLRDKLPPVHAGFRFRNGMLGNSLLPENWKLLNTTGSWGVQLPEDVAPARRLSRLCRVGMVSEHGPAVVITIW